MSTTSDFGTAQVAFNEAILEKLEDAYAVIEDLREAAQRMLNLMQLQELRIRTLEALALKAVTNG